MPRFFKNNLFAPFLSRFSLSLPLSLSLFLSSAIDSPFYHIVNVEGEPTQRETRLKILAPRTYLSFDPADGFFRRNTGRGPLESGEGESRPEATGPGYSGSLNRFLGLVPAIAGGGRRRGAAMPRRRGSSGPKRPKKRQPAERISREKEREREREREIRTIAPSSNNENGTPRNHARQFRLNYPLRNDAKLNRRCATLRIGSEAGDFSEQFFLEGTKSPSFNCYE